MSRHRLQSQASGLTLIFKLFSSTVLAQIAVLGATAFAASRSSPVEFAQYGVITTIATVLATFNTWAAESRLAVVSLSSSARMTRAAFSIIGITTVLVMVAGVIAETRGFSGWALSGLLTAAGAGLTGLQQLVTAEIMRELRRDWLARARLAQGVSNAVLILLLLWWSVPAHVALTGAWVLSLILANAVLLMAVPSMVKHLRPGSPRDFRELFSELRWQPIANLLVGVVGGLPMMILPAVGAAAVAGSWALVMRVVVPVVSTMQATLQPIYYGQAVLLQRNQESAELHRYFTLWWRRMIPLSLAAVVGFWLVIKFMFPLLGPEWVTPGAVLASGLIYYGSLFFNLPVSQTLLILGRLDLQMRWTIARTVVCVLPWAFTPWLGGELTLFIWALMAALTFILQVDMERRAVRSNVSAAETSP